MRIREDDVKKAVFIAKKNMAGLVYNFQAMEGMPFTLPEVQTYLQGITVGGHKVSDEEKLKQQAVGWKRLVEVVERGEFKLTKKLTCELESLVAKDEALEAGVFRSGPVWITGHEYTPPDYTLLDYKFEALGARAEATNNVMERGFIVSLDFTRNQYFYDGNKRTGLLMMNGIS